jgi:plasmid stability protein/uncharacterized protein YnzC (UPF0291/DUF896 family)
MPTRPLTVMLPETLLKRIRSRARRSKRTVEAEIVQLLSDAIAGSDGLLANGAPAKNPRVSPDQPEVALPEEDPLPPDIAEAVARIGTLDDRALREAMKPLMTPKQAKRLADLNYKAQDKGLTAAEKAEQSELLHVYDKSMVVRAAVMAELHKRGADIADLIAT